MISVKLKLKRYVKLKNTDIHLSLYVATISAVK